MEVEYLKNNIPLYKIYLKGTDSIGIGIVFNIGSIYEEKEKRGISHFLEHMMFKSNEKYSTEQIDYGLELNGGISNAYTSQDITVFLVETIPEGFEKILDILYYAIINKKYKEDEFEKEKKVILSEILRYENDPEDLLNINISKSLFGNSDLGDPIGGTKETINNIYKEDIEEFKERYYNPDNMSIIVEGNFNDYHIKKIKEYFEKIEGNSDKKKNPSIDNGNDIIIKKKEIKDQIYFSLSTYFDINDIFYLEALESLLSGGVSSKIFQIFRNKYGIGYTQSLNSWSIYNYSILSLLIPGFDINKEKLLDEAINYFIDKYEEYVDKEYIDGRIKREKFLFLTKVKNNIFRRLFEEAIYIIKFGKSLEEIENEEEKIIKEKYNELGKYLKELNKGRKVFIYPENNDERN
ncbi:MAG: M16 family metallopeptidase [Nanopusillaceae archaeon]